MDIRIKVITDENYDLTHEQQSELSRIASANGYEFDFDCASDMNEEEVEVELENGNTVEGLIYTCEFWISELEYKDALYLYIDLANLNLQSDFIVWVNINDNSQFGLNNGIEWAKEELLTIEVVEPIKEVFALIEGSELEEKKDELKRQTLTFLKTKNGLPFFKKELAIEWVNRAIAELIEHEKAKSRAFEHAIYMKLANIGSFQPMDKENIRIHIEEPFT